MEETIGTTSDNNNGRNPCEVRKIKERGTYSTCTIYITQKMSHIYSEKYVVPA